VKYAAIADWAGDKQYSVSFMCAQLGVARQGYYRWLTDGPSEHDHTDTQLTDQIRTIHAELHGHPGVRRIWAELVVRGVRTGRKRVWRLMRAAGLQGRHPRAWKRTTIAGQRPIDAPDLIGQDFTAADPDTRRVGDITYVQTVDGWVYTATVIDLHSHKVVGYAVADHLRTSLIIEALAAALVTRKPAAGVIFHSDRGSNIPPSLGVSRVHEHVPRIHGGKNQSMSVPAAPTNRVWDQPKPTKIDLQFFTRGPVSDPDSGAATAEPQLGDRVAVQRPIRHHHPAPAQQHVHLGQRQVLLQPGRDLRPMGLKGLPGLPNTVWPVRAHHTDHRPTVNSSRPHSCVSPAASTYRRTVLRSTSANAAIARSERPSSHSRRIFLTSITDTSR
jgi:hypothetical protein